MANRRQLVKRRKTVRNIRKITQTMQLIATARFQQAMNRALATRPYAEKLTAMARSASSSAAEGTAPPLLKVNEGNRAAFIILTSDRGLCGGYNGNVVRTAIMEMRQRREQGQQIDIHALGKKGINYFRFLGEETHSRDVILSDPPRFEQAASLADRMIEAYASEELASVSVCYMRFLSAGSQRPEVLQLLPIAKPDSGHSDGESRLPTRETTIDYLPEPAELLAELLPATVRMRLFQCITDATASEQVARMVAMKAATDAAGDMIKLLTQQYNRARQTQITMELLDIIGGAAAIS